jgi:signal transduction histidine kinase
MNAFRRWAAMFPLPKRTLRMRLTLLYSMLFFVLCLALLTITNIPVLRGSSSRSVQKEPGGSAIAIAQHGADVHQLVVASAIALIVSVALSVALGWLIAGRLLWPLRTITTTAREISARNLHQRLDLTGPDDEFRELGTTLNNLFGRLEASFESQRHFVANASHELRTPLTAERTLLQVALADPNATVDTLRSTCEEVLQLGVQQERLIESLLTLASSEGGIEQWAPIDLRKMTQNVILQRSQETERHKIHIESTLEPARTFGDPNLIESLVANLVDNALRHNVVGGWIEILTSRTDEGATISVRNSGATIPAHEVDRLFRPFQQLGNERIGQNDGHGLGLAIVTAIVDAHGAALTAKMLPEGGLDVVVTFPMQRLVG